MKGPNKIVFLLAFAIFTAFCGCSPAKRIARILKRHPELIKTDTVYQVRTITIPGHTYVDSVTKNKNTATIYSILKQLVPKSDTVFITKIKRDIVKQYLAKPCLQSPKTFMLPDGSKAILSENAGELVLQHIKPETKTQITVPIQSNKVEVKEAGIDWQTFLNGMIIGWVVAIIVLLIYAKGGKQ